jgi:hypothetical protein
MAIVKIPIIVEAKPPMSAKREKNDFAYVSIYLFVGAY